MDIILQQLLGGFSELLNPLVGPLAGSGGIGQSNLILYVGQRFPGFLCFCRR
jgi:hypothetical protein